MALHLQPGTVLDGRYRIDAVLGQGGFGITYAAENARLGMKVAVKELFWRDHSVRAVEASPEVALANAMDGEVFEEQKRRFLREARILKDLDRQPGVVRVIDFFEANGTAYIVMEFVEGETLAAKAAAGRMPAGDVMRRLLPLVDTLAQIHRQGVIHRDISPENIMVQPDGSLKLIDFGAAREFQEGDGRYTSLSRESYSPNEQYDSNGRQGPWTDVYALCATAYSCVCGAPPQSAVQRMFLDELKSPSALGVDIDPACEAILMKGLKLWSGERYQSMEALAADIRAALPAGETPSRSPRTLLIGILTGLLCAAVALALWLGLRGERDPFRGAATEKLRLLVPSDMVASDFVTAQTELRARLDELAGKDHYILTPKSDAIDVELPLECLAGQDPETFLRQHLMGLLPGKAVSWQYQIQANWEDPATISNPGANQVAYSAMQGETLVYLYAMDSDADKKYLAIDFQELKKRLDALDTPYAFGTFYGDDTKPVFRISPEHFGKGIESTLGTNSLRLVSTDNMTGIYISQSNTQVEVVEAEGGAYALRIQFDQSNDQERLEEITRAMVDAGLDTLYLNNYNYYDVFASMRVDAPVTDGVVEFSELRQKGVSVADADHRWVLDYIATLLGDTSVSTFYNVVSCDQLDANGAFDFDAGSKAIPFGMQSTGFSTNEEALALMERIQQETGYAFEEGKTLDLKLNLPVDDNLPAAIEERLPALLDDYDLWHFKHAKGLFVLLAKGENYTCQLLIDTMYDSVQNQFYNSCSMFSFGEELAPYAEAIRAWWDTYGANEYGFVYVYDD